MLVYFAVLLGFLGCKKQELLQNEQQIPKQEVGKSVLSVIDSLQEINFFVKDRPNPDAPRKAATTVNNNLQLLNTGGDVEYTDETYMVFGLQLNNPYSIPNMTAAYNAFFNMNLTTVSVTHRYIRFYPANEAQVALLDDSLELDLYTHPLDYEMLQDGDLYVHSGGSIEDLPYLYTVVPAGYSLAGTVPYQVLADLHLPVGSAALYIEELAESMAVGAQYSAQTMAQPGPTLTVISREDVSLPNGEHPTWQHRYTDCYVEPDNPEPICPGDPINPPPPPPPPPPALVCGMAPLNCTDEGKPRGRIRVLDTQLGICEPVADVKIRTKNWFKIDNGRTDANGIFFVDREYSKRVKVNVIFRNDEVTVRPLRNRVGIRLSLFPITYTLGVYRNMCEVNKIDKVFERPNDRLSKGFEAWLACNAVNSRREQIAFAESPAEGIKAMKNFRLNVYLQKYGMDYSEGPTADALLQNYLFRTRSIGDWAIEVGKLALYYFSKDVVGMTVTVLGNVFGSQRPDIVYSYNSHPDDPSRALENLSSNEVNQEFYEVYTKVGVLKATTNGLKWKNYFKQKSKMVDLGAGHFGTMLKGLFLALNIKLPHLPIPAGSSIYPYGSYAAAAISIFQAINYDFGEPSPEYYEMVNGFSTFYGHRMCALRYGALADGIYNQKRQLITSSGGISAHTVLLEDWQPNVAVDLERNLRIGIFHDLVDSNEDIITPELFLLRNRSDLVFGNSIKSMFNSITAQAGNIQWQSPERWAHFADNTKSQYPGQIIALNDIFIAYLIQEP